MAVAFDEDLLREEMSDKLSEDLLPSACVAQTAVKSKSDLLLRGDIVSCARYSGLVDLRASLVEWCSGLPC